MNDIQKPLPAVEDSRATWVTRGRIPYLDGFRALAATAVVIEHMTPHLPASVSKIPVLMTGHMGVTLFFVISGFLITLLMIREKERSGTVSIKNFYIRRVFRIFPAYFFYLSVMFALQLLGYIHYASKYWIAAGLYTTSYMPHFNTARELSHTWSLSVEEHFYFIWPMVFLCLGAPRALKLLLGYVLCIPLLRYGIWHFFGNIIDVDFASISQMGSIATGCLLAFIANRSAFTQVLDRIQKFPTLFFALGIVALYLNNFLARSGKYSILFCDPVSAVCFGLILLSVLSMKTELAGIRRFLDWKPVVSIGVMSYSIYLWQQPFTAFGVFTHLPHWSLHFVLIALAATFSYWCIETPFLRIKDKHYSNH